MSVILLGVMGGWCAPAAAYQQKVSFNTYADAHSFFRRDGESVSRRRITSDVSLMAWDILSGTTGYVTDRPGLSLQLSLRFFGDYGVPAMVTNPDNVDRYVPGEAPMEMEVPVVFMDVERLWAGHLHLRIGRQVHWDFLGVMALDGVRAMLALPSVVSLQVLGGLDVNGTSVLGYDSLEIDGVDNRGQTALDRLAYPSREEPERRISLGAEMALDMAYWLELAAGARMVGIGERTASRRVGGRFFVGDDRLHVSGEVEMNPLLDRYDDIGDAAEEGTLVTRVDGNVGIGVIPNLFVRLSYELFRPVFMAESIFNIFGLLPRRDITGSLSIQVHPRLELASWGYVSLADPKTEPVVNNRGSVSGGGGGSGVNYRADDTRLSVRVSGKREWDAVRLSSEASGSRLLANEHLMVGARVSAWYMEDVVLSFGVGTVVGYAIFARWQLAEPTMVAFELSHFFGSGETARLAALASLHVELWK